MDTEPHPRPGRTWFFPSVVLLLATAAVGAMLYPGMPDTVPVHWNGAGQPDRFAGKTMLAVFSPLLVGAGVVALLWLLHRVLPAVAAKGAPDDPVRAALEVRAGKEVLAALSPALAVVFSWLCLTGWLAVNSAWTIWPPMLLLLAFTLWLVIRAIRAVSGAQSGPR